MISKYSCYLFLLLISLINGIKINDNDYLTKQARNLIRKIDRISKFDVNNDNNDDIIMNILVEKLNVLIFQNDIKREGIDRRDFDNMWQKRDNISEDIEAGTYDINTKEAVSFDRGYQVSFQTEYDIYNSTEYDDLAYKMALLSDNRAYLGVYDNKPEISFHFDDIELANTMAIRFEQYSIWDWGASDEIPNPHHPKNNTDQ